VVDGRIKYELVVVDEMVDMAETIWKMVLTCK
jgi:hypothetical protein